MSFVDDVIDKYRDLERRLRHIERLDVNPPLSGVATYSGTPVANAIAYWTGAGTVAGDRAIYVNSGGSVSIGTATAASKFHVAYAAAPSLATLAGALYLENGGAGAGDGNLGGAIVLSGPSGNLGTTHGAMIYAYQNGADADNIGLQFAYHGNTGGNTRIVAFDINSLGIEAVLELTATGGLIVGGLTSKGATELGVQAGASTNDAAVGGVLYEDHATNANGTTVETDLSSYTVPADTLSANGMSLEFEAWVTFTNNANTKTLKLYFGSDTWTLPSIGGAASTLYLKGYIVRTGAATQDVFYTAALDNSSPRHVFSTATRTLSGSNVLKLTGQSSAASNDLKQEFFIVKFNDQNT